MNYGRALVAVVALAAFFEFLLPVFSAKTGFLVPLIQKNCGAVPLFIDAVTSYETTASDRVWAGFMKCGAGFIAFLVLPGVLSFFSYLFKFVIGGGKKRGGEWNR